MGLLDNLFLATSNPAPNPGMFQLGGHDPDMTSPVDVLDYTNSVPTKKRMTDKEDEDLKRFREEHPIGAADATLPAPALGMLSALPQAQAWPQPAPAPSVFDAGAPPVTGLPGQPAAAPAQPPQAPLSPLEQKMMAMAGPNQPVTGLGPAFSAPMPAAAPRPRPVAPPQAPPIAVGNYQMPRIGPASSYAPAAQPAAPPSPDAAASPPQRVGSAVGSPAEGAIDLTDAPIGMLGKVWKGIQSNSGLLMGLGAGMLGAPSWATGLSRGTAGAAAGAQQDYKMNLQTGSQEQLYRALVSAGVPPQQAVAATTNPELAKTLMTNYLTDRKSEVKVVKDSLGNERLVAVNPYMSQDQLDKLNKEGPGGVGGGATDLTHMPITIDPTTGRDERFMDAFKAADPVNAAATEAIMAGRMPADARNLQVLMKYASRIDPTFNNETFKTRAALDKSYFGGGEGFKGLRSANTAIDHGIQLQKAIGDLKNFSLMPDFTNRVTGKISEQYSAPYQKALAAFDRWRSIYAHELEFALTGKNTVTGTKEMADQFDRYGSPDKNQQSLTSSLESLKERIGEHESAYQRGMGHATGEPFRDMLTNRAKLKKLLGEDDGAVPASAAGSPVKVNSVEEARKLPKGTRFVDPNGIQRVVP